AILHGGKRVPGVRGNGVSLQKGEYVDYGDSIDLDFPANSPFTIAGWIRTTQESGTILSQTHSVKDWSSISVRIQTVFLGVYLHGPSKRTPGAGIQGRP